MSIHTSRNICILSLLILWMASSQAAAQDLASEAQEKGSISDASGETASSDCTPSDDAESSSLLESSNHTTPTESSDSDAESEISEMAEQPETTEIEPQLETAETEPQPETAETEPQPDASVTATQPEPSSNNVQQAAENSASQNDVLTAEEEAELMAALEADAQSVESSSAKSENPIVNAIQSMNPDMAVIADFALAWFSEDKPLQTGAHDPKMIGFNLQQLEMSLAASVDHIFGFSANLVFGQAGVELEEAVVTTQGLPAGLQVRAGQFLSRIGRINNTHPHTWDFVDQPFAIGKFYGAEGNRGLGVELSWLTPLPWYVEIAGAAQMPTSNASNRSFLGNDGEVEGAQDFLYTLTAKQFFSFSDEVGLFWGISYQTAPNNTGRDTRSHIYATDLYLKYTPTAYPEMFLSLQAEAFFRQRQVPRDNLFDAVGYAQIVWQINRHWATGLRGEYGSGLTNDMLDPEWTDDRYRATAQVTWYPSHFSRLRAQGAIDVPKWQKDPIYALFLALEITAGTHPAHSY